MGGYPPRNPQVAGEKATLAVWLTPELAAHPAYKTAISLFQRAYPGLRVAVTPVAKSNYSGLLDQQVSGRRGLALRAWRSAAKMGWPCLRRVEM